MIVSDSDQESMNSSSTEEGEVWKLGLCFYNNHSSKKLKQLTESALNLDDCFNANYNYESLRSHLVSQPNSYKNYNNFISST